MSVTFAVYDANEQPQEQLVLSYLGLIKEFKNVLFEGIVHAIGDSHKGMLKGSVFKAQDVRIHSDAFFLIFIPPTEQEKSPFVMDEIAASKFNKEVQEIIGFWANHINATEVSLDEENLCAIVIKFKGAGQSVANIISDTKRTSFELINGAKQ